MDNNEVLEESDEILSLILIKLPAKSIHRFKCVSRRWKSIINNSHFISSFLSLHGPSWVMLDRIIRVDLKPNAKLVKFHLQYSPGVSSLQIAPYQMADEPFLEFFGRKSPCIMHCSNGVILFQYKNPYQPKPFIVDQQFHIDSRFEEGTLFVANPLTGEWVPIPKPPNGFLHAGTIGFISQANSFGILERFLVVEYQPLKGSNLATLMCFSSQTRKWVNKSANYMHSMHEWGCQGTLEFDGKLFWYDDDYGLIVWDDPFGDLDRKGTIECRFIAKPMPFRTIAVEVGGGFIQCFQKSPEGEGEGYNAWLYFWRLKNHQGEGEWSLAGKLSVLDIWSHKSYLAYGFGKTVPTWCFMHPWEADVVFFRIQGRIFSLNIRTKIVESCSDGYTSIIEYGFVIPHVIPSWPTSLSSCKQGDNNFTARKFNEAISFYTKSIALSQSAEAYANRAMSYMMVSRIDEAEDDCTQALNLDTSYFKAYSLRALVKKQLGDIEGSMYDVEAALKLEPDDKEMKQLYAELKPLVEKDNLSNLPDDLLIYILSHMKTTEVAATSLLSKRWRQLPDSVPSFHFEKVNTKLFFYIIEALKRYKAKAITKFILEVAIDLELGLVELSPILDYLGRKQLQELELTIPMNKNFHLKLTPFHYLVSLNLSLECKIVVEDFCLPSLKSVTLEYVSFFDFHSITLFFRNCPSLKTFSTVNEEWDEHQILVIDSASLRDLIFDFTSHYVPPDKIPTKVVSLQCPNLDFFEYRCESLDNISSFPRTSIRKGSIRCSEFSWVFLHQLLNIFARAEILEIKLLDLNTELDNHHQEVVLMEVRNLKLFLHGATSASILHWLSYILRCSPKIKSLTLSLGHWYNDESTLKSAMDIVFDISSTIELHLINLASSVRKNFYPFAADSDEEEITTEVLDGYLALQWGYALL